MSKFTDTLLAIKDENLTKQQLEYFHQELCQFKGDMKLEIATVLKKKALYLADKPELSVAQRKINWGASELGQRELELKGLIGACNSSLESTKARLFSIY